MSSPFFPCKPAGIRLYMARLAFYTFSYNGLGSSGFDVRKYKAVVLHRGQVDTRTNIKCNKCLQEGHKSYECPNDWVCRTCGGSGHKASYCTTCPDDWVCQTCGKSGHTAKYCNADSDSSSEDSQSESESDSDIPTHPESCQKDASQTTQAADTEHKMPSFTFNK
ncbi:CNBP [Mytilus edulis]|uniref:CNBP n=1 Tax=Mytilus edulis TaxID=6550 RepID=A0A8S3S0D4_MYTED|nr:CNBP [Mytilus edulis]